MGQELFILIVLIAIIGAAIVAARHRAGDGHGGKWQSSNRGNPTTIVSGTRVTVFPSDGGWKYVVSDERAGDDDEPEFSDPFETQEQAKHEAFAFVRGEPSRYQSMYEQKAESREERRREKWESVIKEREQLIKDASDLLARSDLNVTTLRKPEARIKSQLKALDWQIPQYRKDSVSKGAITQAERQKVTLRALAQRIEARIAEIKATRKSKAHE